MESFLLINFNDILQAFATLIRPSHTISYAMLPFTLTIHFYCYEISKSSWLNLNSIDMGIIIIVEGYGFERVETHYPLIYKLKKKYE